MVNSILEGVKEVGKASIRLLNQPIVKESVKNIAGTVTFVFGLVEIYDLCQIIQGRKISTERYLDYPKWVQVAHKVTIICAKLSIVLSAAVSRPGVFIISSSIGCFFTTPQLNQVFGPNTTFAVNPWHPRHVISIVAMVLAMPSFAQSTYKGINWVYKKIRCYHTRAANGKSSITCLTDTKIRLMALFNTITSRPTLHVGNQFGRFIMRLA